MPFLGCFSVMSVEKFTVAQPQEWKHQPFHEL